MYFFNFVVLYCLFDISTTYLTASSNGIRFSISDLTVAHPRLLTCVYQERVGISLYDSLHESGSEAKEFFFPPKTITQVSNLLARFQRICKAHGVLPENTIIFATEALRTAKNKDEMLRAIRKATGLCLSLLSPKVESLLGAMGARSEFARVDGLFLDLGGGSVQITYVNSTYGPNYEFRAAQAAHSMPFGAAKLSSALEDPVSGKIAVEKLQVEMITAVKYLKETFPALKSQLESDEGVAIYLCGGGFRGYGSMLMHLDVIQPYPIGDIGGYRVPGNRFKDWQKMLLANKQEGSVYGLSKRRRRQFPAIAMVVKTLVEAVPHIKSAIFCSGGNREGALFMKLSPSIRETDPFPLIPTPISKYDPRILSFVSGLLSKAIPCSHPAVFTPHVLYYIARNIWTNQGLKYNASRTLSESITSVRNTFPSLEHELCAMLAITISARWGFDLGHADAQTSQNLQEIVGADLAWWCKYIGTACRFMATIFPVFPSSQKLLEQSFSWNGIWSNSLGKKGKKEGILLKIKLRKELYRGILGAAKGEGSLKKMWKKIKHGSKLHRNVKVKIHWLNDN